MPQDLSFYGTSVENASRPIYWNLPSVYNQVVLYALFLISIVIFINGIICRYQLWSSGKGSKRSLRLTLERLYYFLLNAGFQKKVNRERKAGLFHSMIVLGFFVLLATTTAVFLSYDFGIDVYSGVPYLALTLASDLFGLLFLIGIGLAYKRRYIEKPDKLHSNRGDRFMLSLLGYLIIQGFLLEGLRIHATIDPWAHYSFVGLMVSKFFWSLSPESTSVLHFIVWWIHAVSFFLFLSLLPYTKFFHIISSSLNLFFLELDKPKGSLRSPGDLEKILESAMEEGADEFSIGVGSIADLDWKSRLDLDACTSCGRCQDVCPAYNSGKILSPKWLILDTRDHMLSLHKDGKLDGVNKAPSVLTPVFDALAKIDSLLLEVFLLNESPSIYPDRYRRTDRVLPQSSPKDALGKNPEALLAGEVMDEEVFWSCTTCRACMEVCPVGIEHVDLIVETRRNMLLMHGSVPAEAQPILRAIESQGTPIGNSEERSDWTKGLDIRFLNAGDSVDILYWVGCISAFDKRKQDIAKSMVKILNASHLSWGMLGNLERCTGDPARRLGDENTFQQSAKTNITTFKTLSFKKIVTHCPHCFNTIKNEYPDFGSIGISPENVIHHSSFLKELIEDGTISIHPENKGLITFHDPCYLGRYNDIYEEPRDALVQIGFSRVKEMESNKQKSMCCGAGGGHYWFDMKVGERVNVQRVDQAVETGSDTIASSCPFCMQMLEDGIKLTNREETLKVRDIAELVAESLC
ncbi:MAG TPA: heterodisulfide reductase-related iron-sulfur binding cluster [Oligoflexia bacterium]|nr:heterodisulfide reductase-related iron-sulfur binding cluster [Oligoflexia bacterium]HMP47875.1 heterodisulfide reductase-related iron-sulfur binding cluster [Oligoflexia bacterium]